MKTPDFFATKCRTFKAKHWNFPSKKSDVFIFRSGNISVIKPANGGNRNKEESSGQAGLLLLQ